MLIEGTIKAFSKQNDPVVLIRLDSLQPIKPGRQMGPERRLLCRHENPASICSYHSAATFLFINAYSLIENPNVCPRKWLTE